MLVQLKKVTPLQAAKVSAVLYFVLSIPLVIFMALTFSAMPDVPGKPSGALLFFLPVLYVVIGFVFTAIFAWVYNQIAKFVGGFEFEFSEKKA